MSFSIWPIWAWGFGESLIHSLDRDSGQRDTERTQSAPPTLLNVEMARFSQILLGKSAHPAPGPLVPTIESTPLPLKSQEASFRDKQIQPSQDFGVSQVWSLGGDVGGIGLPRKGLAPANQTSHSPLTTVAPWKTVPTQLGPLRGTEIWHLRM